MYHSITIIGRITKEPELKKMSDGNPIIIINIAANYKRNRKGQPSIATTWFRATLLGQRALLAKERLRVGQIVMIEGHLKSDPTTGGPCMYTRADGSTLCMFEVFANKIIAMPNTYSTVRTPLKQPQPTKNSEF